jgi:hypothetical protein
VSLYIRAINDDKNLGYASVPNGTLKSLVLTEEEKLGLSAKSIALHTVRGRGNRGNLDAFNLNQVSPIRDIRLGLSFESSASV